MLGFFPAEMPMPAIEIDTRAFWEGCKRHELLIQRCKACGAFRYIPSPICQKCHGFEHDLVASKGIGSVYSYIIVYHPAHPATRGVLPYNAAVVQLNDCGSVKITSNVIGVPPENVHIGMPVQLIWDDVSPEITLPRFRPLPG